MERLTGFEPVNTNFADLLLQPLGYRRILVASLGFGPRNATVKGVSSPRGSARKEMYTLFPMRIVYHFLWYVSIRGGNVYVKGVLPLVVTKTPNEYRGYFFYVYYIL